MQASSEEGEEGTSNNSSFDIEDFLEGTYINIKDSEVRRLEFSLDKISVVDKLDFNQNPVKKVQFLVKDPARGPNQTEKKFELPRRHAGKIYKELKNGKHVLEISRFGTGKETNYIVRPIN